MTYRISLSSVRIPEEAYPLMERALREGKIGQSEYIEMFEQAICDFVGSKYCIAVSSGTMADAVAVAAFREIHSIKRVIVPALTFIAHPNSVRYNSLEVVFRDVKDDWTINVGGLSIDHEELLFPAALMGRSVAHGFAPGHPFIEDACEAFGTKGPGGKYVGTYGDMGTYSFFPSHTISTGEGGAIVTDNFDIATLCRILRSHGAVSNEPERKFKFDYLGFNARMSTMQAVIGISLMKHIHEYISEKRAIFKLMQERFGGFVEKPGEEVVPHAYPIAFESEESRDLGMKTILKSGVECRKFFSCIPKDEKPYLQAGLFPMAEKISHTHLYLPCHQNMNPDDVFFMEEVLSGIPGIL